MAGHRTKFCVVLFLGLLQNSLGRPCGSSEAQTCEEEDDVLSHLQLLKKHGAGGTVDCNIGAELCTDKADGLVQLPAGCHQMPSCQCQSGGLRCGETEQTDAAEAAAVKDGSQNKPKEDQQADDEKDQGATGPVNCNIGAELCTDKADGPVQLPAGCPKMSSCQCQSGGLHCGRISSREPKEASETTEENEQTHAAEAADEKNQVATGPVNCKTGAELCVANPDGPVQLPAGCPATPCTCQSGGLKCGDLSGHSTEDVTIKIG